MRCLALFGPIVILGLGALVPGGCEKVPAAASAQTPSGPAPERLRIDGSTTLYPAFQELVQRYRTAHPAVQIELSQSASGIGINRLIAGEINIAIVSRDLKQSELDAGTNIGKRLRAFLIGYDAIGVILNAERGKSIRHLNREQVRKVFFDGTVTDWSQLDPALSGPINVYTRDAKVSGTASVFNELVAGSEMVPYVTRTKVVDETPQIVEAVAKDPNGIGFAPFAYLNPTVSALDYGNTDAELVPCTLPAVRSDRYRLKRTLNVVVTTPVSTAVAEFVDFVTSEEGQTVIAQKKFAPIH